MPVPMLSIHKLTQEECQVFEAYNAWSGTTEASSWQVRIQAKDTGHRNLGQENYLPHKGDGFQIHSSSSQKGQEYKLCILQESSIDFLGRLQDDNLQKNWRVLIVCINNRLMVLLQRYTTKSSSQQLPPLSQTPNSEKKVQSVSNHVIPQMQTTA